MRLNRTALAIAVSVTALATSHTAFAQDAATAPAAPQADPAASDQAADPGSEIIVTGTRGFELSSAVYTHTQLVKQGVDADLHVWEGMFHGFFYNPDVPESRDCYDVIVKFFARRLGGG